jgi:ABC-type antimicrobial peptide transport system permease subunit
VIVGLGIGLVVALAGSRVLQHLLFGIGSTDPATYALASLAIVAVALGASYLPARRAADVEPMVALRGD